MKKGRSTYNFHLNCDIGSVNQLVQSYMNANGFKFESQNGENYYKAGDAMVGYKYFNYNITGNNLTIYAWLKGGFGDIEIEQDGITSMNISIMSYRNSLNQLFQEIEKINLPTSNGTNQVGNKITGYDPYTGQPIYEGQSIIGYNPQTGHPIYGYAANNASGNITSNMQNNVNQFSQKFQDETIKKQENLCEIAFWISIFGLIASFLGVTYGLLVYVLEFYFASQGLKTRKKGKAIATIIMAIISILIIVLQLITM